MFPTATEGMVKEQVKNLAGNATQRYENAQSNRKQKQSKRRSDLQSKFTESEIACGSLDSGVDTFDCDAQLRIPLDPASSESELES